MAGPGPRRPAAAGEAETRGGGLYLQSSLIMSAMVSVLISVLWCFTEPLLLWLRQDPEVSRAAAAFVGAQIPGLFAFSFLQCLLRYLQTQSMAPFALHVALAHLLVNVLGLGLAGASAAVSATFWVSCLMLLAYMLRSEAFSETWTGFSADAFKYMLPTVKLAMPPAVMVCLEYWAFELLLLIAGLLPNSTVSNSLIAMWRCLGAPRCRLSTQSRQASVTKWPM